LAAEAAGASGRGSLEKPEAGEKRRERAKVENPANGAGAGRFLPPGMSGGDGEGGGDRRRRRR
jgi:hypothetical protein